MRRILHQSDDCRLMMDMEQVHSRTSSPE
jgi:hypothetical protein